MSGYYDRRSRELGFVFTAEHAAIEQGVRALESRDVWADLRSAMDDLRRSRPTPRPTLTLIVGGGGLGDDGDTDG